MVDHRGVRRTQRVLAQVPLGGPGQGVVGDAGGLGHRGQPAVARLRQDRGVEVAAQLRVPVRLAAGVGELLRPGRPAVDLDQQLGQLRPRQQVHQLQAQLLDRVRHRHRRELRDDDLALVGHPHRPVAGGQQRLQLAERGVQLLADLLQRLVRAGRDVDQRAVLSAQSVPPLDREQECGRVRVAARARDPDITGAQRVAQAEQGAQLPVVPVSGGVPGLASVLEVAAPAGRHELRRRPVRRLPAALRIQLAQHLDRRDQRLRLHRRLELQPADHVRRELPQVGEAGVDQGQVPVVALQPVLRIAAGRAQAVHPDPAAQPAADLCVRDLLVGGHREDLLQQLPLVLRGLRPRGEQLVQLAPRTVLRAGDRSVEHLHQLVQHFDRALGHGRQQHRELLLIVAAGQGLVGRAPPDPGQAAAAGVRQRREVQAVRVQSAQEPQLVQLTADRHRRG